MLRNRIKIEEKKLEFVFEIVNVQFNQLGQYRLMLTVENPLMAGSGSGVQLRVNDEEIIQANTVSTDTVEQACLEEVYAFSSNKFVFTLPEGFCKNDRNHDVRLKVEAIRVTDSEVKAGEGFFAIYPRTNAPQINLYAEPGEELYQYSGIMALLRVQNDYLAMHCGRLLYAVALHEAKAVNLNENNSCCLPLVKEEKLYNRGHVPWPCSAHVYSLESFEQQCGTLHVQKSQDTEYTLPSLWLQVPILNAEPDAKIDSSRESLPSSPRSATGTEQLKTKTETDLSGLALFPHEHTPSQSPAPFPYIYVALKLHIRFTPVSPNIMS